MQKFKNFITKILKLLKKDHNILKVHSFYLDIKQTKVIKKSHSEIACTT